jgi:hypothetical protein
VDRFIGYSVLITINNYNILKITVIITYGKSHTKSSQADFKFFFNYELSRGYVLSATDSQLDSIL